MLRCYFRVPLYISVFGCSIYHSSLTSRRATLFRSKSFTSQQATSNIMPFRRLTQKEKENKAEAKRLKLAQEENQRAEDEARKEAETKRREDEDTKRKEAEDQKGREAEDKRRMEREAAAQRKRDEEQCVPFLGHFFKLM